MLKKETPLEICVIDTRIRDNLIRLRREKGISLADLGRLSGIPYINRIESGNKTIGKWQVIRLALALNVDISEFYKPEGRIEPRTRQILAICESLSTGNKELLLDLAKSIAAHDMRLKWRE